MNAVASLASLDFARIYAELAERLRPLYLAEIARLAETLRPRFESGELRGFREEEDDEVGSPFRGDALPLFVLEREVEEHFGLDPEKHGHDEAYRAAYAIRLVSPHENDTEDVQPVCGQAVIAATYDVLTVARERGYYTPAPNEAIGYLRGGTFGNPEPAAEAA